MIIFGWGKRTVKEHGEAYPINCSNCNNQSFFKLVSIKTWFTVFFIPIISYKLENLLICPICNNGYELDKNNFERAKKLIEYTRVYKSGGITREEYEVYMDEIDLFGEN